MLLTSQPGFGLESVLSCAFFLNLSLLKRSQKPTLSFLSSRETEENEQGAGFSRLGLFEPPKPQTNESRQVTISSLAGETL